MEIKLNLKYYQYGNIVLKLCYNSDTRFKIEEKI